MDGSLLAPPDGDMSDHDTIMSPRSMTNLWRTRAHRENELIKARERVINQQQTAAMRLQRAFRSYWQHHKALRERGEMSPSIVRHRRMMPADRPVMRHLLLNEVSHSVTSSGLGKGPPRTKGERLHVDMRLYRASRDGDIESMSGLLSSGADVGYKDTWDGLTPLMVAAYRGHTSAVIMLVSHGAKSMARGARNMTALHWAAGFGHKDICEVLRFRGRANPYATDEGLETPIMRARRNGHTRVVEALTREDTGEARDWMKAWQEMRAMSRARDVLKRAVRKAKERIRQEMEEAGQGDSEAARAEAGAEGEAGGAPPPMLKRRGST